jgi:hypothetical protein
MPSLLADLPRGYVWQVPAGRRRRMAQAAATIESAPPLEDPAHGANGGRMRYATTEQLSMDRRSAVLAQDTVFFKLAANREHKVFHGPIGTSNEVGHRRAVVPVHLTERLISSPLNPVMNGTHANSKVLGYLAH